LHLGIKEDKQFTVNNYNIKLTNIRRIFIDDLAFYVAMDDTEIEAESFWLKFETDQVRLKWLSLLSKRPFGN